MFSCDINTVHRTIIGEEKVVTGFKADREGERHLEAKLSAKVEERKNKIPPCGKFKAIPRSLCRFFFFGVEMKQMKTFANYVANVNLSFFKNERSKNLKYLRMRTLLTRIWRKATAQNWSTTQMVATIGPQCNGWFGNRDTIERHDGTDWLRAAEGRCSIIRHLYRVASLTVSPSLYGIG